MKQFAQFTDIDAVLEAQYTNIDAPDAPVKFDVIPSYWWFDNAKLVHDMSTLVTIAKAVPLTVTLEADTGSSATDNITNNGKVIVSGVVQYAKWLYSTDSGTTWTRGASTNFFMLADNVTYAADAIQVTQVDVGGYNSAITKMGAITVDKTAPVFNSADTGYGALNQDVVVYDAEVTGGDTGITYTISGADAAKFSIGATDGKIKYNSEPTAETTTPDSITITATDVAGNATTKDVEISVVGKLVSASGSSTIDGAKNIDVRSPIVLTFSEEVTANANFKITLTDTNKDGIGWRSDKVQNNQVINADDTTQVTITNVGGKSIVTINPTHDLDFSTHYTVGIDAGAFSNVNGQASAVVNMSFDTVTPVKGGIGIESQTQVADIDALTNSSWWVDGHQSSNVSDPKIVVAGDVKSPIDGTILASVTKDIAVAVSLDPVWGRVEYDGNIMIRGITDTNDIVYEDVGNKPRSVDVRDGYQRTPVDSGWSAYGEKPLFPEYTDKNGSSKGISPLLSGHHLYRVTYENSEGVHSDQKLFDDGVGQIIIG